MKIDKNFLLILKSSGLGDGEPDLGEKLIKAFLETLYESGTLPARIICLNSGIFLTTEGSSVHEVMRKFLDQGTEIFSCGTCLDYYNRKEKLIIGEPSNMKATVDSFLNFEKIIWP